MDQRSPCPKGIALYVRKITQRRHKSAKLFARLCSDNGLSWIALGGPWHDKREGSREIFINPPEIIAEYASELAYVGVAPHIWGYPWHDRVDLFVEHMELCSTSDIVGWLLDPEVGLKKHPVEAGNLFRQCRASNPHRMLGMSSYGLPRQHKTFPYSAFAEQGIEGDPKVECDYGSPQLYTLSRKQIIKGLVDYENLGFDNVVPSFGNYVWSESNGKNRAISATRAVLNRHLKNFVITRVPIPAAIGWAENFVTRAQWRVIAEWSELFHRGATVLNGTGDKNEDES